MTVADKAGKKDGGKSKSAELRGLWSHNPNTEHSCLSLEIEREESLPRHYTIDFGDFRPLSTVVKTVYSSKSHVLATLMPIDALN